MHLVMVGGAFAAATGLTLGTDWPLAVDLAIWCWAILFGLFNYAAGNPKDRAAILARMTRPDGPGITPR
ncbi:MAG: hypothetical protein AAFY65_08450 [Pseudomonadota bacterium]